METPHIGVVRDSMLTNPRLNRPSLGRSKSKGLVCPGPNFVYGMVTTIQDGGVAEAISSWYCPSAEGRRGGAPRRPERDFVSLNREGLKSGLVTAKELQQYRGTHNISRPAPVRGVERRSMPTLVPPDMTFGICNRPSTPIGELLHQQYRQRWIQQQIDRHTALQDQNTKRQLGRVQDTRTSVLRKSRPTVVSSPLWKLPQFQQVGPALDTFRDTAARQRALKAQQSDAARGPGAHGQGTNIKD
ncbi:cilia- and flagella-associated protein 77 [Clupea harengus]|uniref:Cilia- and flagella-associated protein 77 n=1 Tax=Clupea harengus TaxID=7950 RepID=A0A6P8FDZ9_CLUHA|nr:cilia- and flagella-associated protein 77 [Clupea harengus]XP_031426698.1 cilia- and flagella-associated protein 77 [Clupea harengus]